MPSWKKVITSGSHAELSSLYAPSITGSLHGTASWAENTISASYAQTASYVTASGVYGPYGSNSVISSSYASSSTRSDSTLQTDVLVLNQTGFNISKGTVVRITGSNTSSDIPRITTASYEDDADSANTLGITTQNINNGAQGFVITEGVLLGIDTSNYISGQLLYLGATGSITGSAPIAPLHTVRLGEVIRQQSNNGSIYVSINNGYELGELHDVKDTTTTSSYGDLLVKSGSIWVTGKQLTGSYGLTGSLTATSFTGSLFGTASWAQNAITASYILNAVSASFATSASSVPVSGVVGLNLSQIVTGSVTASVSPTQFTVTSGSSTELIVRGNGVTIGNAATDIHTITGSARITGSLTVTGSTTLYNSGSNILTVSGSLGSMFTVIDSNSGSLLEVNNSSSATIFKVNSDNTVLLGDPTASALFTTVKTTTISGSNVIYSLPTSSYDGAFFDYTVRSGSNARAGQIMAIWSGSSVNFTGSVTADFGDTSGISLAVIITGSNMALTGSSTTAGWTVKTIVRGI